MGLITSLLLGCGLAPATAPSSPPPEEPAPARSASSELVSTPDVEPEPEPTRISLAAVGDILPHRDVKAAAAARGWAELFAPVRPSIQAADLAFGNLEAPIAPEAHRGIHGEVFNAPASLAPGLAAVGFDVLAVANNHGFDQGPAGLVETLERVEAAGMQAVGGGRSCEEARAPARIEVKGQRLAVLATVDLLNLDERAGEHAPCLFVAGERCTASCGPNRDAHYYPADEDRLLAAVRSAAAASDALVLSFHWGDEYRSEPLPIYPPLARRLLDAGVDVLIGHHPHVLQPIEEHLTPDGRRTVVAYSLGNFISNMGARYDSSHSDPRRGRTRDGGVLTLDLLLSPNRPNRVESVRLLPTWTENDARSRAPGEPPQIRVLPHRSQQGGPSLTPALAAQRQQVVAGVIAPAYLPPAEAAPR